MTWVKLDDGFTEHPKVIGLPSDAARWFHVRALCYAARYRTDGVITAAILRGLGGKPATAEALVAAGLWDELDVVDAWQIHDFAEYNPRQETTPELSARRAEAGRKGGLARVANTQAPTKQNQAKPSKQNQANDQADLLPRRRGRASRPVPSRPLPVPGNNSRRLSSSSSLPGAEHRRDDDDEPEFSDGAVLILSALRLRRIEPDLAADARQLADEVAVDSIQTAIESCRADGVKPWPDKIRERLPDLTDGLEARKRKYGGSIGNPNFRPASVNGLLAGTAETGANDA
jgi:hypothetical protein